MVKDKIEIFKNSRLILGLSVLLIAVFSAGLISKEANRTVQVWAASSNLSPGSLISENDIQKVSVLLPDSSKNYISVRAQIVGAIVLNKINVGELIPVAAVSASANSFNQRLVPISVAVTDIPLSLNRGDIIDIYGIPTRDSKFFTEPRLISEQISVSEVLKETNSGVVSITAIFSGDQVLPLLEALSDSKVVVVRSF
ncbi:MAG: hypothetical protein RLZZ147_661 [Actinomycetota bacterium]|nr:flagellar basal body P-ring biosynthesis protein [Actinomycetota bacterium]